MNYKWNYYSLNQQQILCRDELVNALGISPVLCTLLIQRGITTKEKAISFFNPNLKDLHDPFLLPDMDKAVTRIEKALGEKQRILIYGDYDVDGTTAVALMYKFLRKFTTNLDYYIPDRYDEGYGISEQGIDYAEKTGVKLIIALDCGIKAIDKVEYAKSKGIDFIIGDHHMPDEILPAAVAVIDAKRVDSTYPYEHLSGCGIGFKIAQAISINNKLRFSEIADLLDLVAVSIASDIVPLTGENRILTYYGLKQLNNNPSLGLKGIIDVAGIPQKNITISDIIFKIGPRINASGRVMNGKEAVDLLLAGSVEEAKSKSLNINEYNDSRRRLDKRITEEAIYYIDNELDIKNKKCIVVYNENWHKGVIGIVASRLTEKYLRPAVVLTKSHDMITGSARSVMGFDVYKAIESCKDIIENFGGHTYAAGLSLKEENLKNFISRFEELSFDGIAPEMMCPQIDIDAVINFSDVDEKYLSDLNAFAPFGPENPNPIFASQNVKDYGTSKRVGKELIHIKLDLTDDSVHKPVNGIAFRASSHFPLIKSGDNFNICYTIEENYHNGSKIFQLYVKDIEKTI